MSKTYDLTKNELNTLGRLIDIAATEQMIFNAVTNEYKAFLADTVFKRLSIEKRKIARSSIDMNKGKLIIKDNVQKK